MTADRGPDRPAGADRAGGDGPEPADEEWLDEEWGDPVGSSVSSALRVRAKLAVAGFLAPVATALAVVGLVATTGLPSVAVPYLLLGVPVLSLGSIGIVLWQSDLLFDFPDWFPAPEWLARPPTLSDRLPDHHKAAFSPETRARRATSETDERLAAALAYFTVYLAVLPLYGLLLMLVAG